MFNAASEPGPGAQSSPPGKSGKYLTFTLAKEEYGISLFQVREIIRLMNITPLPQMPPHVKGVINLRGRIIPVMDLRQKFGMELAAETSRTCIVVVEVNAASGPQLAGMLVDSVSEVLPIQAADIDPPPSFGGKGDTRYIQGIGKAKGAVKILLDIDCVWSEEQLAFSMEVQ